MTTEETTRNGPEYGAACAPGDRAAVHPAAGVPAAGRGMTVTPGRAARELELRRDEFEFAALTGIVRTVPGPGPGPGLWAGPADSPVDIARRRVPYTEIERLRAAEDFPDGLHERVRTVGTTEGARLLEVTPQRFARLARTGHFSPVRFYVNRYRAVVWLYPAAELGEFAAEHPGLLTGRLPPDVREREDARADWRPRNWRARRLGLLLRAGDDPWVRAAAIAALLDPVHRAEVVDDPFERAYLDRLRPAPPGWLPTSPVAREIADRILLADDPDEILWHRMSLALALDEARADRQAPLPGAPHPTTVRAPWNSPVPAPPVPATGVRPRAALPRTAGPEPGSRPAAAPGRPPAGVRLPGRRIRRSLLDRLRGRRAARSHGT